MKSNIAIFQGIENFRKEVTKINTLQDKTGFQKYQVSVTAIAKLMAANFSILISTNSDQNLSKANDEGSSYFVFIYMSWELLYLTSKVSLLSIFFRCLSAWKISEWCMYIPFWDNFDQRILKPDWLETL